MGIYIYDLDGTPSMPSFLAVPSVPSVPSEPKDQKLLSAGADALPEECLLWNDVAASDFGRVKSVSPERLKKIREARKVLPNLADWRQAIQRLNSWPHAHGQNDNGWVAGFDYLISNDKHRNLNLLALAEGAKGGKPQATLKEIRRGSQYADDQGWENVPFVEVAK